MIAYKRVLTLKFAMLILSEFIPSVKLEQYALCESHHVKLIEVKRNNGILVDLYICNSDFRNDLKMKLVSFHTDYNLTGISWGMSFYFCSLTTFKDLNAQFLSWI